MKAAISAAAGEIPNYYEPGWEWWGFVLAGVGLVVSGFVMAYSVPLFGGLVEDTQGSPWRWPLLILGAFIGIAAIVAGWMLPGALMRHTPTSGGAFWYFVGAFLVGLFTWGVSWWLVSHMKAWAFALPAVVICAGSVVHGVAEILTRTAASIPTSVGQLSALVLFGAVGLGVYALGNRR